MTGVWKLGPTESCLFVESSKIFVNTYIKEVVKPLIKAMYPISAKVLVCETPFLVLLVILMCMAHQV